MPVILTQGHDEWLCLELNLHKVCGVRAGDDIAEPV